MYVDSISFEEYVIYPAIYLIFVTDPLAVTWPLLTVSNFCAPRET
jgi:hypothetical protein